MKSKSQLLFSSIIFSLFCSFFNFFLTVLDSSEWRHKYLWETLSIGTKKVNSGVAAQLDGWCWSTLLNPQKWILGFTFYLSSLTLDAWNIFNQTKLKFINYIPCSETQTLLYICHYHLATYKHEVDDDIAHENMT